MICGEARDHRVKAGRSRSCGHLSSVARAHHEVTVYDAEGACLWRYRRRRIGEDDVEARPTAFGQGFEQRVLVRCEDGPFAAFRGSEDQRGLVFVLGGSGR